MAIPNRPHGEWLHLGAVTPSIDTLVSARDVISEWFLRFASSQRDNARRDTLFAFSFACFSALRKELVSAVNLVLGDMSLQRILKRERSIVEPLQVGMDNGAKRALIPTENKRDFLEVSADIIEHVDPVFFGDPKTAAFKASGLV